MKALFLFLAIPFFAFSSPPANEENQIRIGIAGYPVSNLFYVGFDDYSEAITSLVLEPLVRLNLETLMPEPALAQRFSSNKTHTRFELELNPKAQFSDGSPVTADDIEYTWKVLKSSPASMQAYASQFSNLIKLEKVHSKLIFTSTSPIPEGMGLFSKFFVLSKKHFQKGSVEKDFNDSFTGSGPYIFQSVLWGKSVTLQKNPSYWAKKEAEQKGKYSIEKVEFLTQSDPSLLFQMLIKHEIDYLYFLSAKSWALDTQHPLFQAGAIQKLEVKNKIPFAMAGIAWNLRKPLFQDKQVRKALAHLFNRPRLIRDFFYDQYQAATGVAYFGSSFHHPDNQPVPYDPLKAKQLLSEAGWARNQQNFLEKNGQVLSFEILTGTPPASKYLAYYQEDLRKLGIRATIRVVDWASYLKLRQQGEFDAIDFCRNRDEQMADLGMTWDGFRAQDPQSGNVTGFSNTKVDALLVKLNTTLNKPERASIVRQLDKLIAEEYPMVFTWEPRSQRIAFWNHFSFQGPGFFNYSRWNQLFHDWRWTHSKSS